MSGLINGIGKADGAIFSGSGTISPEAFNLVREGVDVPQAVQNATLALLAAKVPVDGETAETKPGADIAKPRLTPGTSATSALVRGGFSTYMTQLLGELRDLLGESGVSELEGRLSVFREMAQARQKTLDKVSTQFDQAVTETDDAATLYEAAKGDVATAESKAAGAREQLKAAEQELASVEEDDPSRTQLLQKRDAAQKVLQTATQKVHTATEELKRLSADLMQKLKNAMDIETSANTAAQEVGPGADRTQLTSSAARLSLLMSELTKIIGDGSEAALKNDQALFKQLQVQRQQAMDKAADEYDAQVAKSEKISKTMGCIGKVVGYLLTAVSIVALPFTGGASMALAVIGLGLAAADAVTSAITGGTSLTGMAMGPLMTGVIQPMIELIGKVIAAALEAFGVPKEKAELAGNILAAIYVAIATIVLMVAVSTMARSPAAGRALARMAKTTIGNALKTVFKPVAKALAKPAKNFDPAQVRKFSTMADYAKVGLNAANGGMQGGGGIAQGVFMKHGADSEAELVLSQSVLKQLERMLRNASEHFGEMRKTGADLTTIASEAAQRHAQTARAGMGRWRG